MPQPILNVQNVSKHFGRQQVLKHVSLTVQPGDIYALIGQNGAGKTTLMRLICGLSPLTEGQIMLLGSSIKSSHPPLGRIGAMIESPAAFNQLTVAQNLHLTAIQHGLTDRKAEQDALHFVSLEKKAKTRAGHLSLGQKQRLGLATAILARPDFLVLDEPINGLDPTGIVEFRQLLHRLNTEYNTTILISSHILTELYQVAKTFGFLHHGTIIKELSKEDLDTEKQGGLRVTVDKVKLAAQTLDAAGIKKFTVLNDQQLSVPLGQIEPAKLSKLLVDAGVGVTAMAEHTTSLEDYYTDLIAKQEA